MVLDVSWILTYNTRTINCHFAGITSPGDRRVVVESRCCRLGTYEKPAYRGYAGAQSTKQCRLIPPPPVIINPLTLLDHLSKLKPILCPLPPESLGLEEASLSR